MFGEVFLVAEEGLAGQGHVQPDREEAIHAAEDELLHSVEGWGQDGDGRDTPDDEAQLAQR